MHCRPPRYRLTGRTGVVAGTPDPPAQFESDRDGRVLAHPSVKREYATAVLFAKWDVVTHTERLVASLVDDLRPVRPLRPPIVRAMSWLVAEIAIFLAFTVVHGFRPDLAEQFAKPEFLFEWGAALLTAVVTAIAMFHVSIPGQKGWWVQISAGAIGVWVFSLVLGAVAEVRALGLDGIVMRTSWECVEFLTGSAFLTIGAALYVVRAGAASSPAATVMLTAISVTALGSWNLELFHRLDTITQLLVWHLTTITAILVAARVGGPGLLARFAAIAAGGISEH